MEKIQVDFNRFQDLLYDANLPEEIKKVFVLMAELDQRYGPKFAMRVFYETRDALNPIINQAVIAQIISRAKASEGQSIVENIWLALSEHFVAFATHLPTEYDFEADSAKLPAFLSKYLTPDAFHWVGTNHPELLITKTNSDGKV